MIPAEWHASNTLPHKPLPRRKAERWIADNNPHKPGSPESEALIARFWDDQRWMRDLRRKTDRAAAAAGLAGGVIAAVVAAIAKGLS